MENKTVWLVYLQHTYESPCLCGIYSSENKAKEAIRVLEQEEPPMRMEQYVYEDHVVQ